MSVLIKGMVMPDKATTIVVFPEGKARVFRQDIDHDEWLTAIEVPTPHGRLIDADAMNEKFGDWYTEEGTEEGFIGALKYLIAEQPTIIEGEHEK